MVDEYTGWSAAGVLASGDASKQVSLQATFKRPGTYCATFTLEPLDVLTGATTAPVQAEAVIEWAVAGNTVKRRISVVNGASIQGVGEGVRIVVDDASTASAGGAVVLGKRYAVTVAVAPGPRGTSSTPPYLRREHIAQSVAGGANATIAIPQGVGVKAVLVTVAATAGAAIPDQGAIVTQQDAAANAVAKYDPRTVAWAPLAPGAVSVNLANFTAAAEEFAVFWGIEG